MTSRYLAALAVFFGLAGCSSQPLITGIGGDIEVLFATYGGNCGAPKGNVTTQLSNACNNTNRCEYEVNYKVIGDPARGCAKTYEAEYRCRSRNQTRNLSAPGEAGLGTVVVLDCTRSVWDVIFRGPG